MTLDLASRFLDTMAVVRAADDVALATFIYRVAFIYGFFFVSIVQSGGFISQCSNNISDNLFVGLFLRISLLVSIHFVLHEYTHPSA